MVGAYEHLASMHGARESVVSRNGVVYPVAVGQLRAPDPRSVLVIHGRPLVADPGLLRAGRAYLDSVSAHSPGLHDGAVLAMERVENGVLHVAPSNYYAMLSTCNAVAAELETARALGLDSQPDLPMRQLASELAGGDPLHSGAGRASAVGVSVVVTVPGASGRALVVGRRQNDLAADPGRWHVAPSGMLEPEGLFDTVRRELDEELGVELSDGSHLHVLGLAHDLLRLRPEICLRLDLDQWTGLPASILEFDRFALVGIDPDGLSQFWADHPPDLLTPAAAGAVALLELSLAPEPPGGGD